MVFALPAQNFELVNINAILSEVSNNFSHRIRQYQRHFAFFAGDLTPHSRKLSSALKFEGLATSLD